MKRKMLVFGAMCALSLNACGNDSNQTGSLGDDGAGAGGPGGLAGQSSTSANAINAGAGGTSKQIATGGVSGGTAVAGKAGSAGNVKNGGAGGATGVGGKGASTLDRKFDPVVLAGDSLALLVGKEPGKVVAFSYNGAWIQIPVQVDERAEVDYYNLYNKQNVWSMTAGAFTNLVYVDPTTLTGPDTDPKIDKDDEIVFMAHDAGRKPDTFSIPPGIVAGSAIEVHITEPKDATKEGYVYIFQSDGSLNADAGKRYGTYKFKLIAGTYPSNYSFSKGPNLEDSTFKSAVYERHFGDRWLTDVTKIFADGATGVDILDIFESALPDGCGRNVGTYDTDEGALVTNKAGAVRTIRSYMGSNSGPLTEKMHIFYEAREDQTVFMRVHALPWGPIETHDYSAEAVGMKYYNVNNTGGVVIDGQPDTLVAASNDKRLRWEMVTGKQGTLVTVHDVDTDIEGLTYTSFYQDQKNLATPQCNGDTANAYGQSGPRIDGVFPNTDPRTQPANRMIGHHDIYYFGPSAKVADAEKLDYQNRNPLKTKVSAVGK